MELHWAHSITGRLGTAPYGAPYGAPYCAPDGACGICSTCFYNNRMVQHQIAASGGSKRVKPYTANLGNDIISSFQDAASPPCSAHADKWYPARISSRMIYIYIPPWKWQGQKPSPLRVRCTNGRSEKSVNQVFPALSLTHPTCVRVQTQAISNPATKSVVSACFCSLLLWIQKREEALLLGGWLQVPEGGCEMTGCSAKTQTEDHHISHK